jgi:hypothetical protein
MVQRPRREIWFWVLFAVAFLCSGALFVSGAIWVVTSCKYGWHHSDWQDISLPILMLCFFPVVILGYFKQRAASFLLFCGAGISVLQVLGITRSTGDGLSGGGVHGITIH